MPKKLDSNPSHGRENSEVRKTQDFEKTITMMNSTGSNIYQIRSSSGEISFPIRQDSKVGRSGCELNLDHPAIDSEHCILRLKKTVLTVEDLQSTVGTFVNGKKIPPGRQVILEDGDQLKIGEEVFVVSFGPYIETKAPAKEAQPTEDDADELLEDAENKPSLFKRLFKKKHNDEAPPNPPIKLASKRPGTVVAASADDRKTSGFFLRSLALICDLNLAYVIFSSVRHNSVFKDFYQDNVNVLVKHGFSLFEKYIGPHVEPHIKNLINESFSFKKLFVDVEQFDFAFHFIFVFALVRIIPTFFFGKTISQAFFGIQNTRNIFLARTLGVLRELIGLFTFPFLIFDITLLFGRRSFKEIITYTHLRKSGVFVTTTVVLLFFPLLLIGPFAYPLLLNTDLIERGLKVQRVKSQNNSDVQRGQTMHLDAYGVSFLPVDDSEIYYLPGYDIQMDKGKKLLNPYVAIFNFKENTSGHFKLLRKFDTQKVLKRYFTDDLYLSRSHSILGKHLRGEKHKFDQSYYDEFFGLFFDALSLYPENVATHVLSNGPFISSHIGLRDFLLSEAGLSSKAEFRLQKHKGSVSIHAGELGKDQLHVFILRESHFYHFIWRYKKTRSPKQLEQKMHLYFSELGDFHDDNATQEQMEQIFSNEKHVNYWALYALNNLFHPERDEVFQKQSEFAIFTSNFEFAKSIMNTERKQFANKQKVLLKRYILMFEELAKHGYDSSQIEMKLKELQVAISENNKDYFESVQDEIPPEDKPQSKPMEGPPSEEPKIEDQKKE